MARTMMYGEGIDGPSGLVGRAKGTGLRFTEWMFLLGIGWAYFFSISNPLFGIPLQITFLRHVPLMMLMPALALQLVGVGLYARRVNMGGILLVLWPLLLLASWVTAGSLWAKYVEEVDDTFLTFGIYALLVPFFAMVPARPEAFRSWIKAIITLWLVVAFAALIGELARLPESENLHELEYLVVAPFLTMWFLRPGIILKILAIVLVLIAVIANYKLTGFIIAAAGFLYIAVYTGWKRLERSWRAFYIVLAITAAIAVSGALALAYFEFRAFLPSGNPEVRLNQYTQAWLQFLNSPIWGSSYLDGSGEGYREANRLYNIPTHSDVLDHLKHGGVLGLGLFLLANFLLLKTYICAAIATKGDRLVNAYFTGISMFHVGAFITFSLNPLLLKGPYLVVIFGNLGLALGLALAVSKSGTERTR